MIRILLFVLVVTAGLGLMVATVMPTEKILDQKDALEEARAELSIVEKDNRELKNRIRSYSRDSAIEELARGEYNLVYPGQKIFVLLP